MLFSFISNNIDKTDKRELLDLQTMISCCHHICIIFVSDVEDDKGNRERVVGCCSYQMSHEGIFVVFTATGETGVTPNEIRNVDTIDVDSYRRKGLLRFMLQLIREINFEKKYRQCGAKFDDSRLASKCRDMFLFTNLHSNKHHVYSDLGFEIFDTVESERIFNVMPDSLVNPQLKRMSSLILKSQRGNVNNEPSSLRNKWICMDLRCCIALRARRFSSLQPSFIPLDNDKQQETELMNDGVCACGATKCQGEIDKRLPKKYRCIGCGGFCHDVCCVTAGDDGSNILKRVGLDGAKLVRTKIHAVYCRKCEDH